MIFDSVRIAVVVTLRLTGSKGIGEFSEDFSHGGEAIVSRFKSHVTLSHQHLPHQKLGGNVAVVCLHAVQISGVTVLKNTLQQDADFLGSEGGICDGIQVVFGVGIVNIAVGNRLTRLKAIYCTHALAGVDHCPVTALVDGEIFADMDVGRGGEGICVLNLDEGRFSGNAARCRRKQHQCCGKCGGNLQCDCLCIHNFLPFVVGF